VSNQLKEVETVMQSEALLIAHHNLTAEKQAILDQLLFRFEAIQAAEGKKYVLLNAPKARLAEIAGILPGMKSPTVTPLADPEWVSVQSVIAEDRFWEIIGKLKALGAEGILIIPIELIC
jgi:ATP phosphoribosyltransferase